MVVEKQEFNRQLANLPGDGGVASKRYRRQGRIKYQALVVSRYIRCCCRVTVTGVYNHEQGKISYHDKAGVYFAREGVENTLTQYR